MNHPHLEELLQDPLPQAIRDHLAVCPRCRVLRRLHAVSLEAPPGLDAAREAMAASRSLSMTESLREVEVRPLDVGERVGDWLVGEWLGAGGAATVYRGTHVHTGQASALKVVEATGAQRERTDREERAHQALQHPNVVPLIQRVEHDPPVLVLELVPGPDLAEVLASIDLSTSERVALGADVVAGLASVHAAGLVHRDLKPSNVLVDPRGDRLTARVTDFGLTKAQDSTSRVTRTGTLLGTPYYMSPEQIADPRSVAPASDVFSLCTLLVEMVTGMRLFSGGSLLHIFESIRSDERPSVPDTVPPDLRELLQRGLSLDPGVRPSMDELGAALVSPNAAWAPDTVLQVRELVDDRPIHPVRPMPESFSASRVHGRLRARVRFTLESSRHVALQGPPGCGAWELALAVANDMQASLSGGVFHRLPDVPPQGRWLLVGQALPADADGMSLTVGEEPAAHQEAIEVPGLAVSEARRFVAHHLGTSQLEQADPIVEAANGLPTALRIAAALTRRGVALPRGEALDPWLAAAAEAMEPVAHTVWVALGDDRLTVDALAAAAELDEWDVEDALDDLVSFGVVVTEKVGDPVYRRVVAPLDGA